MTLDKVQLDLANFEYLIVDGAVVRRPRQLNKEESSSCLVRGSALPEFRFNKITDLEASETN